jgi:hypothetical protein
MSTLLNPPASVDGGITFLFHVACPRPAATEQVRWARCAYEPE